MKSKHRLNRMELREERAAYGFLFLSLIGTTVFILVPILMSMFLGFTAWNPMKGLAGVEFTGLENFQIFLQLYRHTINIVVPLHIQMHNIW